MNVLANPAAEKAVLSACYNGGIDIFYDIVDIVKPSTFMEEYNELFFCCIKHAYEQIKVKKCDVASIQAAAQELGIHRIINKAECSNHIRQIIDLHINTNNARNFAKKIRKLEIARLLHKQLGHAQDEILNINGSENVSSILSIAENAVFNFASLLEERDNDPQLINEGLLDYINELKDNPVQQPGISTGFRHFDNAIGGGLRGGTLNVVGARSKGFKSGLALNICKNISKNLPVLYLDTEMIMKDQQGRLAASISKTPIRDIETGLFGQTESTTANVLESVREFSKNKNFFYKNISGFSFEEQLSVMRRWLFKTVGVDTDRRANACVIIYDYLKLMDAEGLNKMAEHQLMGFMMTNLHNFSVMYDIPIMPFVQLNRDGFEREDEGAVSQSDRIIWLCSNFSILKPKSDEEIANDGMAAGNFKLKVCVARHGPGLARGEYISCNAQRQCAFIEEVDLSSNIRLLREQNG